MNVRLQSLTLPGKDIECPLIPMHSVAEVLRAPLFKNESKTTGNEYCIVSIKDFPDCGYLESTGKKINIASQNNKARNYVLQPYDVLITIVGNIGSVCIVPPSIDKDLLPSTNMFVIRFHNDKEIYSIIAYLFFKSTYGMGVLDLLTHGSTIKLINKKSFIKIGLPALNSHVKKSARKMFSKEQSLFDKRKVLLSEAHELTAGFFNEINTSFT